MAEKKSGNSKKKNDTVVPAHLHKLIALATELNENEIAFLENQAATILKNRKITEEQASRRETMKAMDEALNPPKTNDVEFIEGENGNHFIIVARNSRNFLSLDEMRSMVRACHAASNRKEGVRSLFGWFSRFRTDITVNSGIDSASDPVVGAIYDHVIQTYTVKED